jgi:hypothetical protein
MPNLPLRRSGAIPRKNPCRACGAPAPWVGLDGLCRTCRGYTQHRAAVFAHLDFMAQAAEEIGPDGCSRPGESVLAQPNVRLCNRQEP